MDKKQVKYQNVRWVCLICHPRDFTPVPTSEMAEFSRRKNEFDAIDVKLITFSMGTMIDHFDWTLDICRLAKTSRLGFPILEGSKYLAVKFHLKKLGTGFKDPYSMVRSVIKN